MSNRFTSRERMAMIVVAGIVAIAIAALALNRSNASVQNDANDAQMPKIIATDVPDTVKVKTKKRTRKNKKTKHYTSKNENQRVAKHPKPRDYFNSPENE